MLDCVTRPMREGYFNAHGKYASDQEVYAWFVNIILEIAERV